MYRFHPSVHWSAGYPDRQQIVSQITQLWKRYGLQEHTKFNTPVTSVTQDRHGLWIINDPSNGRFDGVMAAVGSCGDPKMPHMPGQEIFKGEVYHSSRLDGKTAQGKKVLIIGGGASAVEALEFVIHTVRNNGAHVYPFGSILSIGTCLRVFTFATLPKTLCSMKQAN